MSTNPLREFHRCYRQATAAGVPLPDAMALASCDQRGRPSVRYVLLKHADEAGFVFYTNLDSRKGRELLANPYAALAFYWDAIGKQIRVEGRVRLVTDDEADAYWATRPRESQLAGATSRQSAPIESHAVLLQRWRELSRALTGVEVGRPDRWTGFRLAPKQIEIWTRGAHRLHRRELYTLGKVGWSKKLLQP